MPRQAGEVNRAKTEAILDAAASLISETGRLPSMEMIAHRAGVSKQTVYNRYASKAALGFALARRISDSVTLPLKRSGRPETVLADLATTMIQTAREASNRMTLRNAVLMSPTAPEMARAIYEGGPGESLRKLAVWLREQDAAGRLSVPDADHAAEMFAGMVLGHTHLRTMLGVPHPNAPTAHRVGEIVGRRFMKAFAPISDI